VPDEGNRTERGRPPAPYGSGTEDTLAAPVTPRTDAATPPQPGEAGTGEGAPTPPRWKPPGAGASVADDREAPSSSLSLPMIDRVRYRIVGEVGRGGLGRVYHARDLYLDRQVAVKELIDPGEPAQRRFVREALITARLQHPSIVPIYDAGQSVEGPFYAMKLVAGRSLADALAETKTLDQRLALLPSVIAVADAMAYAHSERIIHRDLKPQNVLVGDFGETVLIDWGLAKDLNAKDAPSAGPYRAASASTETMDGAVMGTPAFMAPEQAVAGEDVDERADVYALGSMLYFLGAGVPPHGGRSIDEILVKVVAGDVLPLREREPRIPVDLAAIVTKAMAHDPAKRYRTARELSDDLHKFQTGKLVGAKTYTAGERVRRWLRRNRRIVAVAGVALAILVGYGGWSLQQIFAERQRAEDQAARAVASANEAAKQRDAAIAQAMLVRARQYAATGHTAEELVVLRALASAGEDSRRLAITEGGLLWKSHQRLAMALGRDVGLVLRSADGTRFIATEPGSIAVWDAATGNELSRQPLDNTVTSAARFARVPAISPTGRFVVTTVCSQPGCGIVLAGDDTYELRPHTRLELRELVSGHVLASWSGGEQLHRRSLAFSVDDTAIAIRRGDRLQLLDAAGGAARELDVTDCTGSLAIAPGGSHVAIGCRDHVRLAKPDGTATQILRGTTASTQLHFLSADRLVAIGDDVKLWDVARGELRGEGKLPEAPDASAVRDEGEDIEWDYVRPRPPGTAPGAKKRIAIPQIRIGSSTSIVPRTSLLGPPPRLVPGGAIITLEGPDWQALTLDHDRLRYALVDYLVPSEPPERCLWRIGGERHATIALDGGARMLVDEQELATGLAAAPPEGYRHTTTGELPVRQLRPLLAAEADACLVWGRALGAHAVDGGELTIGTRALDDGVGGLIAIDHHVTRIARGGTRSPIATTEYPVASPSGTHVASVDLDTDTLAITAIAPAAVVRTWKVPASATGLSPTVRWIATEVVEVQVGAEPFLVPIDPAVPARKRDADLVTDPRSRYGTKLAGNEVVVVRVADGIEVARHLLASGGGSVRPLPDASGGIVVEHDGTRELIARSKDRIKLAPNRHVRLGELEILDGHLVSRSDDSVAVWELSTGRSVAIPVGARDVAIANGELWAVTGQRKPRLARIQLDGKGTRETRLSTVGLPFHHVRKNLIVSPDGRRLTAEYAVTEELTAIATWDAGSGALLWVGPPTSRVIGDWVLAGGRAFVPVFDVDAILRDTGARTNLRLCKDDLRAVPVVPPPAPDSYWAPDASCAAAADPRR